MSKIKVQYLTISDIHLGHENNKSENILENFRYFIKDNIKLISKLNLIIVVGDIFHKLLSNNSDDFLIAKTLVSELIMLCKTYNIKLRVVEGTPSHDWRQFKVIYELAEEFKVGVDIKYISTLHIEKMDDLGISALYIPDEYKHNAEDTYNDVLRLLADSGLDKVDITAIHGQFHYQLPMVKLKSSHTEENYLNITKHYISAGHIHTFSVFDRIIAQGSFDRLAQNEEEDKGCVVITIYTDETHNYLFLKNKRAMIFKTLDYSNTKLDIDKLLLSIENDIKKIPDKSYVRIFVPIESSLNKSIHSIKTKYKNITIKIETKKQPSLSKGDNVLNTNVVLESFHITKDNIEELLFKEVSNYNLTIVELDICKQELGSILNSL